LKKIDLEQMSTSHEALAVKTGTDIPKNSHTLDKLSLEGVKELPPPTQPTQSTPHQTQLNIAPQSPQEKLERFFDHQRPSVSELKERNILKDSKLAPALQSAEVTPSQPPFTIGGT
jgi:hypothetical protein